jgi:hypothetical protein
MLRFAQFTFALAVFALVAAGGYAVGVMNVEPAPVPECPPPPAPDLEALCAGREPGSTNRLQAAQTQVETLSQQLAAKEAELSQALAEADKAGDAKDAATAKARKLESEVSSLKRQVTEARAERDRLVTELKDTLQKLGEQVVLTEQVTVERDAWKSRSTGEQWGRFVAEAKTTMCDKGTAKRHDACYAAVDGALTPAIRQQFLVCTSSGQAIPSLGQLEKGKSAPPRAVLLPDDKDFVSKGWYVLMCDPSLPENKAPSETKPAEKAPEKP